MVSPYLLRPCRSYEEYLRDRERVAAAMADVGHSPEPREPY